MFYLYRTDQGVETDFAVFKILAAGDDVAVAANVTLWATGATARLFTVGAFSSFKVAGSLISTSMTLDGTGNAQIDVTVQATGSIYSVDGTALSIGSGWVVNDGLIEGNNGILSDGDCTITNTGTIAAVDTAVSFGATSGYPYTYFALYNSGTIVTTRQFGETIKIIYTSSVEIVNTGMILARSSGADVLDVYTGTVSQIDLTNSGTIVGAMRFGGGDCTVDNSGTIKGSLLFGDGADQVTNSGMILSRVNLVPAIDYWNYTGGVTLGGGDDRYDGGASTVGTTVNGGAGDDMLIGGDGNDFFIGGVGADQINGGDGIDSVGFITELGIVDLLYPENNGGASLDDKLISIERLFGSAGADRFFGADADEWLYGFDGADELRGRGGNDVLVGGWGADVIEGGDGRDRIDGGLGVDTASYAGAGAGVDIDLTLTGYQRSGGAGRDRLIGIENLAGSAFADTLRGEGGANRIEGAGGGDMLFGGGGDDTLLGGAGDDAIDGGDGFDVASFEGSAAKITAVLGSAGAQDTGEGLDTLTSIEGLIGSALDDRLTGDSNNNLLDGGAGADTLNGGSGEDVLRDGGGVSDDKLNGGGGVDAADFLAVTTGVTVNLAITVAQNTNAGMDTLTAIENLYGSNVNDLLTGNAGDNVLRGRGGDDILNGAGGSDTADYSDAVSGVAVSLAITTAQNTLSAGTDTLVSIENLTGSAFGDGLTGNAGANILAGGGGNDTLNGGGGNDRFIDVAGGNTFIGGEGTDTADYSGSAVAILVDLFPATDTVKRGAETDTVSVENFIGSAFADTFKSGLTINTYTGGAGADTFSFELNTGSGNTIRDFSGAGGDGDKLLFAGWDSGFGFEQIDATHWRFFDEGHAEVITFTNGATVTAADIILT